jgi:hypothetical protein
VGADDVTDGVGVGEEQPALQAQDHDPGHLPVLGVAEDVAVVAVGPGDLAEHGHVRA